MNPSIAVVDDDGECSARLQRVLGKAGFKVRSYATPGRFFDGVLRAKPALCLVDVQLPGMDGREMVRVLRANPETRTIPVILMSAVSKSSDDVVRGLDSGADEYLPKPLDLDLLIVRVKNLLSLARRGAVPPSTDSMRWGDLLIMPDERRLTLNGKEIPLTHLEFELLLAFLRQPNRVLPRSWLLQNVWNSAASVTTRTVDKHVQSLRKKVPAFGKSVETVVGVGYLFAP